jgi:hypothetical protein
MGCTALLGKAPPARPAAIAIAALLAATLLPASGTGSASAAPLVGKDGKIHACYKAKGKGKGTLRVVRSARVRCPRGWKKAAWNASGQAGSAGEQGAAGGPGGAGEAGGQGAGGAAATSAKISSLESQVTELLTKLKSLESILAGVTNTQLKEAIGNVPVVATLCAEAKKLNEQSNGLGESLSALNTVLDPLLALFSPVSVPAALPAFQCP